MHNAFQAEKSRIQRWKSGFAHAFKSLFMGHFELSDALAAFLDKNKYWAGSIEIEYVEVLDEAVLTRFQQDAFYLYRPEKKGNFM